MTTEYLKLITDDHGKFSKSTERRLQSVFLLYRVYIIFIIFAKNQTVAFILNLFIVLIPLWAFFSQKNWRPFLSSISYHFAFWFVFTIVMIVYKLPNRVSNPLFVLYTFSNIIVLFHFRDQWISYWKPAIQYSAVLLLIGAAMFFSYRVANLLEVFHSRSRLNQQKISEINSLAHNEIVVFAAPAIYLFDGSNPLEEINLNRTNIYVFIGGWTTWYPFIDSSITNLTGSDKFLHFFQYISSVRHVFISDDSHNRVITRYLELVYNRKFVFQQIHKEYETTNFSLVHKSNYYIISSDISRQKTEHPISK